MIDKGQGLIPSEQPVEHVIKGSISCHVPWVVPLVRRVWSVFFIWYGAAKTFATGYMARQKQVRVRHRIIEAVAGNGVDAGNNHRVRIRTILGCCPNLGRMIGGRDETFPPRCPHRRGIP